MVLNGQALQNIRMERARCFRSLREMLRVSRETLAEMLGVSLAAVKQWEAGRNSIPRLSMRYLEFLIETRSMGAGCEPICEEGLTREIKPPIQKSAPAYWRGAHPSKYCRDGQHAICSGTRGVGIQKANCTCRCHGARGKVLSQQKLRAVNAESMRCDAGGSLMIRGEEGQRFLALRAQLGIAQRQLAEILGVSRGSIKNWETGHRRIPFAAMSFLKRLVEIERSRDPSQAQPYER
jgi:DNA-binding transcriptional regulator YiaG